MPTKADTEKGRDNFRSYSDYFLNVAEKKPIVNTEPCYEGHGYGGTYGRFNAFDIRKATWSSVLSGAKAGVSYGAHGLWQIHNIGDAFNNLSFSSMPYGWRSAMQLPGAWDVSFAKWLFCKYEMHDLMPFNGLKARSPMIYSAAKDGMIVIYLPYNHDITVLEDLRDYKIEMFALETRRVLEAGVEYGENESTIHMSQINEDMLIIAKRQPTSGV